jgi:hypothetical protein
VLEICRVIYSNILNLVLIAAIFCGLFTGNNTNFSLKSVVCADECALVVYKGRCANRVVRLSSSLAAEFLIDRRWRVHARCLTFRSRGRNPAQLPHRRSTREAAAILPQIYANVAPMSVTPLSLLYPFVEKSGEPTYQRFVLAGIFARCGGCHGRSFRLHGAASASVIASGRRRFCAAATANFFVSPCMDQGVAPTSREGADLQRQALDGTPDASDGGPCAVAG